MPGLHRRKPARKRGETLSGCAVPVEDHPDAMASIGSNGVTMLPVGKLARCPCKYLHPGADSPSKAQTGSIAGEYGFMSPSKRTLISILMIGIVLMFGLLVTVFLKYREFSENPAKLVKIIPDGADISIDQIHHTAVKDGRKEWSLEATSAKYSDSAKEALFEDVQVSFFLENNREVMVKGRQGRLDTETNDIEISGDVIVQDAEYQLAAETIVYDHVHRKINVPVPVKITGQTFELRASAMTVDLGAETALLKGAVKGTFSGANTSIF